MVSEASQRGTCAWVRLGPGEPAVGDLVSAEAGGLPTYRVLGIEDGRLLMRETQGGRDHIAPLAAMCWKMAL